MLSHPAQVHETNTTLTTIERAIVKLICEGYNSSEIARQLYKSTRTIEGYRRSILEKTGTRNVAGIVIYAIENGLISIKKH
ncbi:MAG: hypothetical protein GC192_07120 [Bacteroidetes bacterium]|nr:hypothetical protein [Bacteroidota bacterium]